MLVSKNRIMTKESLLTFQEAIVVPRTYSEHQHDMNRKVVSDGLHPVPSVGPIREMREGGDWFHPLGTIACPSPARPEQRSGQCLADDPRWVGV